MGVWVAFHRIYLGFIELLRSWSEILSTMARRPRNSRAWHFVLSAARRDADARAVALAGSTNWGYDSDGQVGSSGRGGRGWPKVWRCPRQAGRHYLNTESVGEKDASEARGPVQTWACLLDAPHSHSDSDSDPEYSTLPPSIPSAVPVTGESFCDCAGQSEASFCSSLHSAHRGRDCRCGEEDECERGAQPLLGLHCGRAWGWAGQSPMELSGLPQPGPLLQISTGSGMT
ncbi:SPRY domain-containing SOCS box protein 3 isoform X3 [Homo sapiens]|nr:SPRY domain-containing SOCS box protein 3 isoform X3 [Homo sapiens]